MTETWASSGLDLHLDLSSSRPRAGIERALREAVQTGRLAPGVRLPSSRSLATDLGVSRNTVADAYAQLVAEGWLTAGQGSATRVAARTSPDVALPDPPAAIRPSTTPRFDLSAGAPDVAAFPRSAWLAALRHTLASAPAEDFGYADPRGLDPLRRALAGYLARVRGVRAEPSRVVVCAGFTEALELLGRVLVARGHRQIAVEAFGHRLHRDILAGAGLQCRPLTVDHHGAVVDEIDAARAVLLTPAHQFPVGPVLAPDRRTRAVEWAADVDGVIIEDDYDGEFRYDRRPVGAMQALAADRVVYAGTASKTLAPGLRLAWLVLPASWVEEVVDAKVAAGRQSSTLDQLALAELISSGGYDRCVRRARLRYRRRRDQVVTALRQADLDVRPTGLSAGLHLVAELPEPLTEAGVIAEAERRGLTVQGLIEFATGHQDRSPSVLVGYARPPDHAFTGALARLVATLRAVRGNASGNPSSR